MLERVIGVFKLDVATFEDIEHDTTATMQALIVVVVVAIISAVGSAIGAVVSGGGVVGGIFSSLITVLAGWVVWSALTYFVGTSLFGGQADLGEMLRVIGFAYAPQVLGIIPCIGWIVGAIWSLIAGFIAVRQGLDLDNTKAFLTIAIGFVAYLIIAGIFGAIFGAGSLALGAITG